MVRIIATILMACLVALTGCACLTCSSSKITVQTIVDKTISAMLQVKSYQLDTDFMDNDNTEWKGTKLVNVMDKEMGMNMVITMGTLGVSDEMYFKDGINYLKTIAETNIPPTFGWTKTQLTDDVWNQQIQIPFLIELLNNAPQFTSLESGKINDVDCYLLTISPSAQASVDFVLSQGQPGGPSFFSQESGVVVIPDAYHGGFVKLWLSRDNYLPLRIHAEFDFHEKVWGGVSSTVTRDVNYHDELSFSNYNQPVSIQLPQEVLISPSINQSVVEVWIPDPPEQVSFGVVVGDGTMVLTIINYEEYNPGEVKVVSGGIEFAAKVQAVDSRTGAALLKMDTGKLAAAPIGDATTLKSDEKLLIWSEAGSDTTLTSTDVLVINIPPHNPVLDFNVVFAQSVFHSNGYSGIPFQGAIVTDLDGKVLGLESIYSTRLVIRLGHVGYIPPIISINSMLELLSPEAIGQPWNNGPLLFAANEGSMSRSYDGLVRDYESLAAAINPLLNGLGQPLSISDLPLDFTSYVWSNMGTYTPDGSLLTTVFPRPVELRNSADNVLVQAKWVGIQWGRDEGKPSRIVYGSAAYVVEGSFELTGDVSGLDSVVLTMVNDQMPYGP